MRQYLKYMFLGCLGGLLYIVLELVWRGFSHWTMFFLGGLCFVLLGAINEIIPWEMPIWKQALIGTAIITALEFLTGCIVNCVLEWNVWDYSGVPLNILGQICLPYILLWVPVSLTGIVLDDWLRHWMFNEGWPKYYLK